MGQLAGRPLLKSGITPTATSRRNQLESKDDQQCEQHINGKKYRFRNIVEKDAMQPAFNETSPRGSVSQPVFQPGKRTNHAKEGFTGHEQDGGKMCEPKSAISHEFQSHPVADPDQRQTADDKQHKQEVNDKYDISQHHDYFRLLRELSVVVNRSIGRKPGLLDA